MTEYSKNIEAWLVANYVNAEMLSFAESVHTVEEAVSVSGYPVERFTKSIVMLTADKTVVIAMVPADNRASTERVRKVLNLEERPRVATAEETKQYTGQLIGGNSPLNVPDANVLIDPKVLERDWILTGGGDDQTLVKISIEELKRVVEHTEVRVRK